MKLKRPALRYHGGKWRIANWVISHFPEHKIYVEPFGGAASVLLRKERSFAEVYNDLDGELVNYFRVLRDHGEELIRAAALTPFAREEFVKAFSPDAKLLDPVERARLTLIKSFMGFGSTGISNRKTGFRGKCWRKNGSAAQDWKNWPEKAEALAERLQGVVIENRDALDLIRAQDTPDTLFYVDCPYVHSTRGADHRYRHELTDAQHKELGKLLNKVKGTVVLSGYPCELYDRLYAGWETAEKDALADGAKKRTEKLWIRLN